MAGGNMLRIISYNILMLHDLFSWNTNTPTRRIPVLNFLELLHSQHNNDVFVLQECFDAEFYRLLTSDQVLKQKFPFITPVGGQHKVLKIPNKQDQSEKWDSVNGDYSRAAFLNGGVVIMSKHKITSQHSYIYKNAAFPDFFGNKGCLLAIVEKEGLAYNIVGTHLQSSGKNNSIRLEQLKEMREWLGLPDEGEVFGTSATSQEKEEEEDVNSAICPTTSFSTSLSTRDGGMLEKDAPLIICGDLNFRYVEDNESFKEALKILSADHFIRHATNKTDKQDETHLFTTAGKDSIGSSSSSPSSSFSLGSELTFDEAPMSYCPATNDLCRCTTGGIDVDCRSRGPNSKQLCGSELLDYILVNRDLGHATVLEPQEVITYHLKNPEASRSPPSPPPQRDEPQNESEGSAKIPFILYRWFRKIKSTRVAHTSDHYPILLTVHRD
eukprot:GHVS01088462.1.p1 GENE.GHVS01088462.1~~GHVS01088462.1.p1  ORF type:complete len:440 (-),score=69.71 GHVS01088462.1:260-1579(-)